MTSKALKSALGLTHLTPANIVKQFVTTNGLSYADYVNFWNSLQRTQSGATKMVVELLGKFVELDKTFIKRKKSKEGSKEEDLNERLLWMIINTIRFIDLFLGVEASNQNLRKAHRAYESHRAESPAITSTQREMDLLLKICFRSMFENEDISGALLSEVGSISISFNIEIGSDPTNSGSRDLSFSVLKDCPFTSLRLLAKVSAGGKDSFLIFRECLKQLKAIPALIRSQPSSMNSILGNTLSLLYFVGEAFASYAVLDFDLLNETIATLSVFTNWPLPYGSFASKIVEMIKVEVKIPGTALRRRLRQENPILTEFGLHQYERFGSQGVEWTNAHRTITVLHNSMISRSHVLRKLISRGLYKGKAWTNEMNTCREELLINVFQCLLVSEDASNAPYLHHVGGMMKGKTPAEINEYFTQAMKCINSKTGEVDFKTLTELVGRVGHHLYGLIARETRLEEVSDVFDDGGRERSTSKVVFRPENWIQSTPRLPHISFEFLEIFNVNQRRALTQEHGVLRENDEIDSRLFAKTGSTLGVADLKLPTRSSFIIPGLDMFNTNAFEGENDPFSVAKGTHRCPQNYVGYASDFEELVKDARMVLPPDEVHDPSKQKRNLMKPVLKRVILGGLDVLHRAICTYVALLAVDPQLCARVDIQFFLLPLGRNDLSCFIAQRDGWYRKHVYVPFHSPLLLIPQVKSMGDHADDPLGSIHGESKPTEKGGNPMTPSASSRANRRTSANALLMSAASKLTGGSGMIPSAFDSDGGDFLKGDEDEVLDALEDGGYQHRQSDAPTKKHKFDVIPGKLLRHLLEAYIRGAQNQFPVVVYDCECWESPDAIELDRNPDVTIPFCVRVEIGLGAAIAAVTSSLEFTTNFQGYSMNEGLGADPSLEEVLSDKTFLKAVTGNNPDIKITTPELMVNMFTMGVDGTLDDRFGLELADSNYLSLVVSSVPKFTLPSSAFRNSVSTESFEPPATAANPTFPWLEVQSVAARPALVDLVKKKDKKPKDLENLRDSLRTDCKTHHIGFLDIRSTLSSRMPFLISVDGQGFGPYYRVRIRRSTALSTSGGQSNVLANSPKVLFPIMTFLPFDKS